MESNTFVNQVIFNRGQNVPYIYKLVSGSVHLLTALNQPFMEVTAPYFLNIIESIYQVPCLKTVRANGKCQLQKIKYRQTHKTYLKQFKEKGLRKHNFPLFEEAASCHFYESIRFGQEMELRKGHHFSPLKEVFYFVISGNIIIEKEKKSLKILRLGPGEVLASGKYNWLIEAETQLVKLLQVKQSILQNIFGTELASIKSASLLQTATINKYSRRNQRISLDLKRKKERLSMKSSLPKQFKNKIQQKWEKLQKFCRARSSFERVDLVDSRARMEKGKEVMKENGQKFKQLMELNRRKYGKQYLYNKRLEISRKVHSISGNSQKSKSNPGDLALSIYQIFTLKEHYGIVKQHPQITKSKRNKLKVKESSDISQKGLRKTKKDLETTKKLFISCQRSKQASQHISFSKDTAMLSTIQ